jgi:hypothetical protein
MFEVSVTDCKSAPAQFFGAVASAIIQFAGKKQMC